MEWLDYATLKLIWWCFIGVLLIGFAIMDGFDMGVTMLLPFVGKTDEERRVIVNTVGPVWEGNQTWLITAGGAIFAAWPLVYAAAFSGLYAALLLVLFALFFRPVGFDYRSKLENPVWRNAWDWGLFIGGFVPALVFGIAFGNLLLGLPFHFDDSLRSFYTGSFWALLHPFALLCGVVSCSMLVTHGALYLQLKSSGEIRQRAGRYARIAGIVCMGAFALAGVWVSGLPGFSIVNISDVGAALSPLHKEVAIIEGGWFNNYTLYPWTIIPPVLGFSGIMLALVFAAKSAGTKGAEMSAFFSSSVAIAGIILTAGCAMFPFIMPSSTHPANSLTLWDAVSSKMTLEIMFFVTLVFLPLIMLYTSWVFRVLRGKISVQDIKEKSHVLY